MRLFYPDILKPLYFKAYANHCVKWYNLHSRFYQLPVSRHLSFAQAETTQAFCELCPFYLSSLGFGLLLRAPTCCQRAGLNTATNYTGDRWFLVGQTARAGSLRAAPCPSRAPGLATAPPRGWAKWVSCHLRRGASFSHKSTLSVLSQDQFSTAETEIFLPLENPCV